MKNIVLIGMPGAGKSTIGVVLAKSLGYDFIDSDLIISKLFNRRLQDIINEEGIDKFKDYEEKSILTINENKCVIATGGSAVLEEKAMIHLKRNGIVVFLDLNIENLIKRLSDIKTRGIVIEKNQTIKDVYNFRKPFYEKYADVKIDCNDKSFEEIIGLILRKLNNE